VFDGLLLLLLLFLWASPNIFICFFI